MSTLYTSKPALVGLAERIRCMTGAKKIVFCAFVVTQGLMMPKDFKSKLLYWSTRLGAFIHRNDVLAHYANTLNSHPSGKQVALDTVDQTIDWMLNGKDANDVKSAGGFDRAEIAKIDKCLKTIKVD